MHDESAYALGIDVGTTKTAVVLIDPREAEARWTRSAAHDADRPAPEGQAWQDMDRHLQAAEALVADLPAEARRRVGAVGVTGQMHSVTGADAAGRHFPVATWQDRRASHAGRLDGWRAKAGRPLADGYGAVTLAELAADGALDDWAWAATPADALVRRMTGRVRPGIDPTLAASWGVYDLDAGTWDARAVAALGIPARLLPALMDTGAVAGRTDGGFGLPEGVPVVASIGDHQASVLGGTEAWADALWLTMGTGMQLSAAAPGPWGPADEAFEWRPFLLGWRLATAAPLCGGRGWAWLADAVNAFLAGLGLEAWPADAVFARLDAWAAEAGADAGGLRVRPHFLGERGAPAERGVVDGITPGNFTPPNLARALADGLIDNAARRLPASLSAGRTRVVGSGNALRKSAALRAAAERRFGLPLVLSAGGEEAAVGAARLASRAVDG